MTQKHILPRKDEIINVPVNEIKQAKITSIDVSTWSEKLAGKPEQLKKFQNPEQEIVIFNFKTQEGLTGEDTAVLHRPLPSTSKLAKIISMYGQVTEGQEIQVLFNEHGYARIYLGAQGVSEE